MILKIILALLASCSFAVLGIWLIDEYRKLRLRAYIKSISSRYQDVVALNQSYTFYRLRPDPSKAFFAETKKQFDSFDFDQQLIVLIRRETAYFDELLYAAGQNKQNLRAYFNALELCSAPIDRQTAKHYGVEYRQAAKEEERLIHDILPNPVTDFTFRYVLKYYCPVQKADMEAVKVYSMEEIQELRKKAKKNWPTKLHEKRILRRPNMWRLAILRCEYAQRY